MNTWNDYGYYTLFHPVLWVTAGQSIDLRDVKIIKRAQEPSKTEIADDFYALDDTYCSLVLQRRVVVALRKRFVMRVCCGSWREQIYEGNERASEVAHQMRRCNTRKLAGNPG